MSAQGVINANYPQGSESGVGAVVGACAVQQQGTVGGESALDMTSEICFFG